jgi:hypothetical protein
MYLPFYYFIWFVQVDTLNSPLGGLPLRGYTFHFFVLSVLVPGSYLINLALLSGFVIEAIISWYYFDLSSHPNLALSSEPTLTILFGIIAFTLLAFRYREEILTKKVILDNARNEVLERWAKVILSIRDKANTPLQTLSIAMSNLSREEGIDPNTLSVMENAINKLNSMSELLKKLDERVVWNQRELMTDEQMIKWFRDEKFDDK